MFNLSGKRALLTGASGGIGKAIAQALCTQGAEVVLSGTNEDKLKNTANDIQGKTHILPCDLSDVEAVEGLFGKAEEMTGGIDILICNAGVNKDGLIARMKNEDWDTVIDINLKSCFMLNRAAVKSMMKRRYGRIINISSVVAVAGNPGQANYVASKAGMIGMTKSIGYEVSRRGITANCIAPGFIQTNMTDALNDDQKSRILNNIPMNRMGLPDEIASTAVFLASDEAGYITGQTMHVNGGMLMI